eukprot:11065474-Ditylum_brightwellii.AAC.1
MSVTPLNSPYDKSTRLGNNDTNCTAEGELDAVLLSSVRIAEDWKFVKTTALMILSQRKEGGDVMG